MGKTTRTKVTVPVDQLEIWEDEAEKMNLPRSQYIRMMVQSGRRSFAICETTAGNGDGIDIEEQVMVALHEHESLSWGELVEAAVGDIEEQVEDVIRALEEEGKVDVSLRDGSVTLVR